MTDGSVITFYSYKGGVGRSFLLANVGATLSRWGYRVLCVDFDLEAPGLWHYFSGWARDEKTSENHVSRDGKVLEEYGLNSIEQQVLHLLAHGHANREIAIGLGISEGTAKSLLASVYKKLGVNSRAQAVVAAFKLPTLPIDLDTQAQPADGVESAHTGLLDLVEAFDRGDSVELATFLTHIDLPSPHTPLALLTAGRRDASYMTRVQQLDWGRLYAERNLGARFERIRAAWISQFDFVLVDSRTGVSDTGGICTAQLPDILVTVFAPNRQNLDGIMEVAAKSALRRNELPYDRQGLITIPVLSRFDQRTEQELAREWAKLVERRLEPLLQPWTHRDVTAAQFFERVMVPYFSAWSFGEDVPAVEADENTGPERINYYIDTVAALLANRGAGTEGLVANRDGYVTDVRSGRANLGKPRYDIYLSYSKVDVDFARELARDLERRGLSVFFDAAQPAAGLARKISEALHSSAAMVVLLGKAPARWQVENIRLFLAESKLEDRAVIPVILAQAEESNIPRFLRQYKEVSAFQRPAEEVSQAVTDMLNAYQSAADA